MYLIVHLFSICFYAQIFSNDLLNNVYNSLKNWFRRLFTILLYMHAIMYNPLFKNTCYLIHTVVFLFQKYIFSRYRNNNWSISSGEFCFIYIYIHFTPWDEIWTSNIAINFWRKSFISLNMKYKGKIFYKKAIFNTLFSIHSSFPIANIPMFVYTPLNKLNTPLHLLIQLSTVYKKNIVIFHDFRRFWNNCVP